jgi:predicted O-linked N-acetylglucosamine transferase (SPINDLY family)
VLKRDGRLIEAADAMRRAVAIAPQSVPHRNNLALILTDIGRVDEADAAIAPVLAANPPANIRLRLALMLPGVVQSVEQIDQTRARLEAIVEELLQSRDRLTDPLASLNSLPFFLAYAGQDDRTILEKLAAVHERLCPSLSFTAEHVAKRRPLRGRIRLGILSTNLYFHTIGKLNRGLIQHIDRSRFEIFVLENPSDDPIANEIRATADHHIPSPRTFTSLRQSIARAELDVIFYPDIGMVPTTYYLAFARLAPLQCVTWGHPLTTGLRTLDYFLSSTHLESPGSQSQYVERLHSFPVPGTCYAHPEYVPIDDARAHFSFASDWRLYVCPQTLFKIHPEFDAILARILREDRAARIILLAGNQRGMFPALRERFARTMGGDVERVILLPKLSTNDFLALLAIADANLDTPHFCGGNTSLEAFSIGCPIVTLPSQLLRGRITYALYQQMGLSDCVARDAHHYVQLALRLANDRAWHDEQSRQILERNRVLFDNREVVREFEEFFASTLARQA